MNKTMLLILCCVLLVIPSVAQGTQNPQNPKNCSPIGTWYGGGDYKYIIVVTPITEDTFALRSEGDYSQAAFGYTAWTGWSGQLTRLKNGQYVAQEISFYTTSPEMQPPLNTLEMDAVRGWMQFVNCNKIKFNYDFFAAYFDVSKVPFVATPDLNYLPPGGISETYRRMPLRCPACSLTAAPAMQPRLKH